jgi:hypothetical protein
MRLVLAPKDAVVEEDTAAAGGDEVVVEEAKVVVEVDRVAAEVDMAVAEEDEGAADEDQTETVAHIRHTPPGLLKFSLKSRPRPIVKSSELFPAA